TTTGPFASADRSEYWNTSPSSAAGASKSGALSPAVNAPAAGSDIIKASRPIKRVIRNSCLSKSLKNIRHRAVGSVTQLLRPGQAIKYYADGLEAEDRRVGGCKG